MTIPRCLVLMTDFGLEDAYVGILKSVIERLAPGTQVLDLSHGIPAGQIRWGAYLLQSAWPYLPENSVLVAVVDPGVGSARRGLCLQVGTRYLVGPDNGIFSLVLRQTPASAIYCLENTDYFLHPLSHTFHGRDIFAPVAAHLLNGVPPAQFGPACTDILPLDWPSPHEREPGVLQGEVLLWDHFGNLITNFSRLEVEARLPSHALVRIAIANQMIQGIHKTYAEVAVGTCLAVWGSGGYLEISIHQGDARRALGAEIGTPVYLYLH